MTSCWTGHNDRVRCWVTAFQSIPIFSIWIYRATDNKEVFTSTKSTVWKLRAQKLITQTSGTHDHTSRGCIVWTQQNDEEITYHLSQLRALITNHKYLLAISTSYKTLPCASACCLLLACPCHWTCEESKAPSLCLRQLLLSGSYWTFINIGCQGAGCCCWKRETHCCHWAESKFEKFAARAAWLQNPCRDMNCPCVTRNVSKRSQTDAASTKKKKKLY